MRIIFFLLVCIFSLAQPATRIDPVARARTLMAQEAWQQAEEELRRLRHSNPAEPDVSVLHALCLLRLSQPFDAVIELEELLARQPDHLPALRLYATLTHRVLGDEARAEELLLRCTRLAPGDVESWKGLGTFYLTLTRIQEAISSFDKAASLTPEDPVVLAGLAYAHGQAGATEQAEAGFSRAANAVAKGEANPVVDLLLGEYQLRAGQPAKAMEAFDRVIRQAPGLTDALYYRALASERLQRPQEAEATARKALAQDPRRKDVRQLLIRLYRAYGDHAKAQEQAQGLQSVIEEENRQQEIGRQLRTALGRAEPLLREGKLQEAIGHYETIARLLPTFYEAHFALGICYFQTGRPADAEVSLKRYLELQPLSADGHSALGVLLLSRGRQDEAEAALSRALGLDPDQLEARKGLAQLRYWKADFRGAAELLEPMVSRETEADPELSIMLARSLFALKQEAKAVEVCNQGLRLHGNSPAFLKSLGQLLIDEFWKSTETRRTIARILEQLKEDPEAWLLKAKHSLQMREYEACETELKTALQKGNNGRVSVEAWALLGSVEEKLKRLDQAEEHFRISLEQNRKLAPHDPQAALWHVQFLLRRSRISEADSLIEEILGWAPHYAPTLLERAKLQASAKKREEAVRTANLALQFAGNDLVLLRDVHAFLSRTLFAVGKVEEAKAHQQWLSEHGERR